MIDKIGALDHVRITNESGCTDETRQKIWRKVFKLYLGVAKDLNKLRTECPEIIIEGKISFEPPQIMEYQGGIEVTILLKDA